MKTKITPGPGLYNPEKTYSKISTKFFLKKFKKYFLFYLRFSKAKRKDLSNPQKIPGPGAYKPQLYEITKGSKFTKSIKDSSYITASNEVPGPGKYDIYEKLSKSGLNVKDKHIFLNIIL